MKRGVHSQSQSLHEDVDNRPQKRRRDAGHDGEYSGGFYSRIVLLEELDLEISLRKRLSDMIHSRITWALLLQESLARDLSRHVPDDPDFTETALDALDAIEAPCDILFDRVARLPPKQIILQPREQSSSQHDNIPAAQAPFRAGSTRIRGLPRAPLPPVRKLLFLRNFNTDPPEIAKLACPECERSDFSNLQGLLNHCRIRHHREYGSHDECIESCAVVVPEAERDWVVASGTELSGISSPSLRRLFELAVGEGGRVFAPKRSVAEVVHSAIGEQLPDAAQELLQSSTHITRTLGHHKDSPALAPFLGKAPKRRCVNVYEVEDLDIVGGVANLNGGPRVWHKPYTHRSNARPELDMVAAPTHGDGQDDVQPRPSPLHAMEPAVNTSMLGSRFHITARVNVVDQSLWLPPERRLESRPEHTHRWRLSISSPSYSLHITSFLAQFSVTCLTDPPSSTLLEPITVTEPPFVIMSTADQPFLARIKLTWVGSINPPFEVEHWVDLDPLHLAHPVIGDEQVFDVELDRNTELCPAHEDLREVLWGEEHAATRTHSKPTDVKVEVSADPEYVVKLRSLLPQVPMTLRDAKGRVSTKLPYILVSTPAQFRNLVVGRQKAIEMGCARALRDAYQRDRASHPDQVHISLTTSDVYRWMEDENVFPRSANRKQKVQDANQQFIKSGGELPAASAIPETFCRNCGLHLTLHPLGVKTEDESTDVVKWTNTFTAATPVACLSVNETSATVPLFDVNRLLPSSQSDSKQYPIAAALSSGSPLPTSPGFAPSTSALVASADPRLVTAMRTLVSGRKLDHLSAADQACFDQHTPLFGRTGTHGPRRDIEERLAPYALLALVAKSFIGLLIHRGLEVYRREDMALRTLGREDRPCRRRHMQPEPPIRRLLTPSHVLHGLAMHAQERCGDGAALLCIARLGASSVRDGAHTTDTAPSAHFDEVTRATDGEADRSRSFLEPRRVVVKTEDPDG